MLHTKKIAFYSIYEATLVKNMTKQVTKTP